MSRRISLASAFLVSFLITTSFANRALPDLAPPPDDEGAVPLLVKRDRSASVSRIAIPRKFLGDVKAAAPGSAPNVGAAPNEGAAAAPDPTRSVIAGIALSLAIVASFFAFRKKKPVLAIATAAGALLIGVIGFWVATASANVAPPEERQQKIVIDVVDEGDAVVLTLGRGT